MPAKGQKIDPIKRFWAFVDKRGPDECWPWLGCILQCGYGQFNDGNRMVYAHRFALIVDGRDPGGLDALHAPRCKLLSCVNPAHLRPGTHQENMQDSIRAGTFHFNPSPPGEEAHNVKLSNEEVKLIRSLAASGFSHQKIADQFDVSRSCVRLIARRERWRHLP